mmetsp:Transcript_174613/g.559827  ORF Transcript_174613/g.559827 Transcript_174613/m.559827 type:complete len:249 (-) Transcript_174613:371-1117(-)
MRTCVLLDPRGRCDEAQPAVLPQEVLLVAALDVVVQLQEDATRHAVGDLREVVDGAGDQALQLQHQEPDDPVARHLASDARALHLHGDVKAIVRPRLVHLAQARCGDGLRREAREEVRHLGIAASRTEPRSDRPLVLQVLHDDPVRHFVVKGLVLRLHCLQRLRRLLTDDVGALRQRLAHLHEDGAEALEALFEELGPVVSYVGVLPSLPDRYTDVPDLGDLSTMSHGRQRKKLNSFSLLKPPRNNSS